MSETIRPLVDVQNTKDVRNIPIDKVGVRKVKYPVFIRERDNGLQQTVGEFSLMVGLPRHFKGTHMSRFLEVLAEHNHDVSAETIPDILEGLRDRLNAVTAHLEVRFIYFREKAAPVTGKVGMMGYECAFLASGGEVNDSVLEVIVPVTTLCPCSKEISSFGAHNQRGYVTARIRTSGLVWIEEIVDLVEAAGSAPLYPVLKRPDEKFVTEQAYENPRFVEDMVREVSVAFDAHPLITSYEIEVENHESIHDHNAYAYVKRDRVTP
ncbi:GTP cyclohydrolase FolE2 [Fimbriimonas ginsengisoli]|uniref:GTP cyclohydrolase FolE2 n=1 Tax=Fimbriimonas ginsengisoli Gsoil 348 TaxID=661478 RepID=A0A068NNH5_FIMGI|nr:GTP cyclohydrolase FolE2 [Fimbriimonas ginsengisoli]AIE84957.1 GTP cyclohydrolase I [Fimbriimonas ginsengisoli Gsoil 348]